MLILVQTDINLRLSCFSFIHKLNNSQRTKRLYFVVLLKILFLCDLFVKSIGFAEEFYRIITTRVKE